MNFANNVIIRDASGIFRCKKEVIDLASEGAIEIEGGEEEGEDDVCAQHSWLQTTFLTDESDDEDDEDVAEMGNLFDDLQLANQQRKAEAYLLWSQVFYVFFFVRRALDHCFRFMDGYRKGLTGPVLEYAVKKYKSHRRLFSSLLVETLRKNN